MHSGTTPKTCTGTSVTRFNYPQKLADSRVWQLLAEDMRSLAGKIRVFCDPDVVVLSRTTVEGKDEPILGQSIVELELDVASAELLDEHWAGARSES